MRNSLSAIDRLRTRLRGLDVGSIRLEIGRELAALNREFERTVRASNFSPGEDQVRRSVLAFWKDQELRTLRDAQLVSFGLASAPAAGMHCILEDRTRFRSVLDSRVGVGQWEDSPRKFRRCFQGLMSSYFTYNGYDKGKPVEGRKNWGDLRDYLSSKTKQIVDPQFNLDWVDLAVRYRSLFSSDPCKDCASAALAGDKETIARITTELSIGKSSWFHWKLLMAQVEHSVSQGDSDFLGRIPVLLSLISGNVFVRDPALVLILDRYARLAKRSIHVQLRDCAVSWWGNPWLPSDAVKWGAVKSETREMVAEWLRGEFIEAFFEKLARDGVGDRRRANFWKRYVKSMRDVRFGLGASARASRDADFKVLRDKMRGLTQDLNDPVSANNAFIMTIRDLVVVEFGGDSNALYGYDGRRSLPFSHDLPYEIRVGESNSLKHKEPVGVLWLQHQDGIKGYTRWEDMFEAELRDQFGVQPDPSSVNSQVSRMSVLSPRSTQRPDQVIEAFSTQALTLFASRHGIRVRDMRTRGGNLRLDVQDTIPEVSRVLRAWGFRYNEQGFWWRV